MSASNALYVRYLTVQWSRTETQNYLPVHWHKMVAISLALFIFDEIMRPSVTTYVSEGPRITLRYIRNGFLDIH